MSSYYKNIEVPAKLYKTESMLEQLNDYSYDIITQVPKIKYLNVMARC